MISTKLRNSAKGQPCTFMVPGICTCDPTTTVLCHLYPNGRIMGAKSPDYLAAFGCHACHEAIDRHELPKADELFYSFRAMALTWANWISRGLIVLPVDPETAKRRPKRKANMPSRPLRNPAFKRKMNGTVERRQMEE
jgi:hypothetical protein